MWKLLRFLKPYRKEAVCAPLFKLLEVIFELLVPLVVASMIDNGIGGNDKGELLRSAALMVTLGAVGLASATTAQYFAAKASAGFGANIRYAMMQHIQKRSYAELDQMGTDTMITRITSDVNQVQSGVNLALRLMLRSPFVVIGAMIMAFTVDVKCALIFVAVIPLLTIVVFAIMFGSIPLYQAVQKKLDNILGRTRENLLGVRVLRAFCKEEEEMDAFTAESAALSVMQKRVGRISALMNPATYILLNLAIIFLIWTGALQVEAGVLTQGAVIALYNYMSQILVELIKLANLIITLTKSIASGNRIQDMLSFGENRDETKKQDCKPDADSSATVQFDHVSCRYPQASADALHDISFTAKAGETIGIIGGTGSGKTTLVNLIPGFYPATSGTVSIDGVDVQQYTDASLRAQIGVVPQKAVLFQGTIRENLQWGKQDATDEELYQALEIAQAKEIVEQKAGKLEERITENAGNLSGGQRQRLTIARALVRQPRILILDDSASALDYATDAALRQSLQTMPNRPTTFLVSQRTASLLQADRILVLDGGKLVGNGTHQELLQNCAVYQEIYYSQFPKEVQTNAETA
ncbi:MAG: ABC transporter ATP-binding protein [Oscillospiraceae bacterium]|nr:ABC transporter ATP-binding protein [Oscillospiraceae bacterium]MDY2510837.1 ABC transporter ATP-binding protein [Ruminococcus callidus]